MEQIVPEWIPGTWTLNVGSADTVEVAEAMLGGGVMETCVWAEGVC